MALYMGFTGDMSPLYSELYHPLLITGNFGSFPVDQMELAIFQQVVDLKPNGRTLFLGEFGGVGEGDGGGDGCKGFFHGDTYGDLDIKKKCCQVIQAMTRN